MGKLIEDSQLYAKLSKKYEERDDKDTVSLQFFNECVDVALEYSRREMRYVIFKLKELYDDKDTGLDTSNAMIKIATLLAGNSFKASFMISVLETALDE